MGLGLQSFGGRLRAMAPLVLDLAMPVPQARAIVRAGLFVTQVLPLPVKPQEWMSPDTVREPVTFPLSSGEAMADIYRIPHARRRAGVLVFLGINPAPRDDRRVVNLGHALARSGFVAMFPWSASLIGKRISPDEPDNLVRAFEYLRGLQYVDQDRVGMGGFCVGASLLLVAACDPRINERVNFVSAFGAYYDMRDMLKQISSHRSFYDRTAEPWHPNRLTEEVFTNQLIEGLEGEMDRAILSNIFIEKGATERPALDGLSSEGQGVYRLLSPVANHEEQRPTLDEADRLVRALPFPLLEQQAKISPCAVIGNLKAKLLIAHDREDDLVPAEESRRLADAISSRGPFRHTEFSFFSHVTPDKRVGPLTFVKEAFKLFRYTYSIMRVAV